MPMLTSIALGMSLAAGAPARDPSVADALRRVSGRTVLFGHQSVGANVLDGLARIASSYGVALRFVRLDRPSPIAPRSFSHAYVAANGNAAGKLASFERLLAASGDAPPDLALVKLCWADFDASTDAKATFATYEATLSALEAVYPRTRFVHVTVPLTTVQHGARALFKRLLGRTPYGLVENARREDYNALLRMRYEGRAPIFDLARLEAERRDGGLATAELGGKPVLALAAENTDDGSHLSAAAQDRVARALVELLASLP